MKKYALNGKWRMTGNGYDVEGNIPGSVYSFLYIDNKLLQSQKHSILQFSSVSFISVPWKQLISLSSRSFTSSKST